MELIFSDESLDRLNIDDLEGLMIKAATIACEGEDLDPELIEVSVTFVEPEEIRELNAQYRDKDAVTDVLSFPQFDDWDDLPEEER